MIEKKIFLLEDQLDIQAWISGILSEIFPQHVIVKADSIAEANKLLGSDHFDIAILDINLPDGSGLDILDAFKRNYPDTRCIISTIFDDHKNIFSALQSGADGYIIKSDSRDKFRDSLQHINNGEPPLSPKVASMMLQYFQQQATADITHDLTARQAQILTMIAKGLHNKEIASELGLSVYTIMDHIKRLYENLSITCRAEAALKAQQFGLVD